MHILKGTAVVLTSNVLVCCASTTFKNFGTINGWDGTNHEHQGTVSQVSDQSYKSGTSLRMVQKYDPSYKERYHSEVYKTNVYTAGDEGYYGFAFRLAPDWDTSGDQSYNIAQFITDFTKHPDNDCGDTFQPSMMTWVEGNQLKIRSKGGKYDGQEKWEKTDLVTTFEDDGNEFHFQFRVGLYANSWYDDHQMDGNQGTRQVWIDEVGYGDSYEDADPGEN
ncbi:polysaccharide lyase family 20 protein [Xylariomycetidae sp. FL2044]|nr:polysaccharide lyase family 20 protein [Xylariomycetidae sp. FL2044]